MDRNSIKESSFFSRFFGKEKEPDKTAHEKPGDVKEVQPDTIYVDAKNIWITNDGLLRDEGILFGLTSASFTEKVDAIKSYYKELKGPSEAKKTALTVSLGELRSEKTALESQLVKFQTDYDKPVIETSELKTTLFRNLIGLLLITCGALGSFFLIHYYVSPVYGLAASLGIFFFALFSSITPLSSWLNHEEADVNSFQGRLKSYLLEIGPPLVSTLFVSYLIFEQNNKFVLALIIGLFLLVFFFFCGKLILGIFHKVVEDVKTINESKKHLHKGKNIDQERLRELEKIELARKENSNLIRASEIEMSRLVAECASFDQQAELKINLFLSEYNLAKNYSAREKL